MAKFRDLLLSVLSTTATKREARQYIQKYGSARLGNPGTKWREQVAPKTDNGSLPRLISLVRLSGRNDHEALSDLWIPGLARTLSHIKDLGGSPVVVIDGQPQINAFLGARPRHLREYESQLTVLSDHLAAELEHYGTQSVALASPMEISAEDGNLINRHWLDRALAQDQVPVLLPLAYDRDTNETKLADSFHLCRELVLSLAKQTADLKLDKVIFIDPFGGLPSQRRKHAAHVLVNLQQEYGEISSEIRSTPITSEDDVEKRNAHLTNLDAMQDILRIGGPQTTGIITDPRAAANMLDRNPIIYNILTDRPLISPSLPPNLERSQLRTSLLRTGFPVYVRHSTAHSGLDLRREDKVGNINLTKLQRLIELSFKKKLDLKHYLTRIEQKVAAIIVVGDYDGAAIITWETCASSGRRIAYLDKFAVNPSSQGAQGVADIMLIQMIRRLFPREMLWRSRANNPVNKWYFERSRGHCRLSKSMWTMFWISDAKVPPIAEYEEVCRNIEPSLYTEEAPVTAQVELVNSRSKT